MSGVALLAVASFIYRQLANGREQLRIARQGQITERFTRAIDQLGHPEIDVRVGGIYALERIARYSPADRAPIREALVAFIRTVPRGRRADRVSMARTRQSRRSRRCGTGPRTCRRA